jgi:hypothetical protein
LVAVATELEVDLIVLGHPEEETAVFEQATLQAFAAILRSETDAEVLIL